MEKTNLRCETIEGMLVPCQALLKSIQLNSNIGRSKGIFGMTTVNVKTMEPMRTLIGVKSGDYSKKGLCFNYCPFCGERILEERE